MQIATMGRRLRCVPLVIYISTYYLASTRLNEILNRIVEYEKLLRVFGFAVVGVFGAFAFSVSAAGVRYAINASAMTAAAANPSFTTCKGKQTIFMSKDFADDKDSRMEAHAVSCGVPVKLKKNDATLAKGAELKAEDYSPGTTEVKACSLQRARDTSSTDKCYVEYCFSTSGVPTAIENKLVKRTKAELIGDVACIPCNENRRAVEEGKQVDTGFCKNAEEEVEKAKRALRSDFKEMGIEAVGSYTQLSPEEKRYKDAVDAIRRANPGFTEDFFTGMDPEAVKTGKANDTQLYKIGEKQFTQEQLARLTQEEIKNIPNLSVITGEKDALSNAELRKIEANNTRILEQMAQANPSIVGEIRNQNIQQGYAKVGDNSPTYSLKTPNGSSVDFTEAEFKKLTPENLAAEVQRKLSPSPTSPIDPNINSASRLADLDAKRRQEDTRIGDAPNVTQNNERTRGLLSPNNTNQSPISAESAVGRGAASSQSTIGALNTPNNAQLADTYAKVTAKSSPAERAELQKAIVAHAKELGLSANDLQQIQNDKGIHHGPRTQKYQRDLIKLLQQKR